MFSRLGIFVLNYLLQFAIEQNSRFISINLLWINVVINRNDSKPYMLTKGYLNVNMIVLFEININICYIVLYNFFHFPKIK